jgi:hypothetical protein
MYELARSRFPRTLLCIVLVASWMPPLAFGQEPPQRPAAAAATADSGAPLSSQLDRSRELLKDGNYDDAIEILKPLLEGERTRHESLAEVYLLLIKTYVFIGNDNRFKPQGREVSNLNYQEARKLIAECLAIRELRHTHPEPASEYPEEMIRFFAEVRGKTFGSFRVSELVPSDATVLMDADTLRALPGETSLGDVDLAVGQHLVVVRAKGYKDLTEQIEIPPNSTLEQPYRLDRRRGTAWYATMAAAAAGLVVGTIALASGNGGGSSTTDPLPTAPPPPARSHPARGH